MAKNSICRPCHYLSILKKYSYFHIDINKVNNSCLLIQISFLSLCADLEYAWVAIPEFHNYINVSKENWQMGENTL